MRAEIVYKDDTLWLNYFKVDKSREKIIFRGQGVSFDI